MHKLKRYEQFADAIAELIRTGVLAPNERVPSVRQAGSSYGVSASTVFRAYYLLEDRGLIQARERSGYFVREHAKRQLGQPDISDYLPQATEVGVSELVFSVLDSLKNPSTVPFGSAFVSPDLYPLGPLAKSMSRALRALSPHAIIADMTTGNPDLRRQIALRYMTSGVMQPMEELVITTGAMEALNLCLQAVTKAGDFVAIEAPAFYASLQILERLQLKAVEIPVHPRLGIDLEVLAEHLTKLSIKACWFMSSFQNPLGASLDAPKKQDLYELLQKHQVPLIEDDVYAELYFDTKPPRPIKSLDRDGLVMHCGSFSKSLAPGYRVGWVSGGRYAGKIAQLKLMTTLSPSVPAQAAIAVYLQHGGYDRHLRKLRQCLQTQQTAMLASAARHFPSGTKVTRPSGGYFLWFEFPRGVDSLKLFQMALAQGISLAPGPIFSATQRFTHCVRLNFGHPWSVQSEAAMELLGRMVKSFGQ